MHRLPHITHWARAGTDGWAQSCAAFLFPSQYTHQCFNNRPRLDCYRFQSIHFLNLHRLINCQSIAGNLYCLCSFHSYLISEEKVKVILIWWLRWYLHWDVASCRGVGGSGILMRPGTQHLTPTSLVNYYRNNNHRFYTYCIHCRMRERGGSGGELHLIPINYTEAEI